MLRVLIFLVMGALAATAMAQDAETEDVWTEDGEDGGALPDMVVEAQNEVRQAIEKGAFAIQLDAAGVDSFYSEMDELALGVSPVSGLQPHLNNLEPLASKQPPHYWLPEIPSTPVATFYPEQPEGHRTSRWTLTITDFRGSPCRSFDGGGNPPETVAWDGRDDQGDMLRVGYPYSYVFTTTDKGTNTYNYAGESFRLPALDYRRDGHRVLELAGGEVFPRRESELTAAGADWLVRAADEIRRHPYSPVRVVVTAETEQLATQRAELVADHLAESMILPREQIETESVQRADLRAEMDGTVAVIIEHAD